MHASTEAALLAAIRAELQANPATYAGKSAAEIAALMNAPVVAAAPSPQPRAFLWRSAKALAQEYGRWALIALRARGTPATPPASAADFAVLTALNAISMADDQQIDPAHPVKWATFCGGLASLVAVGDLTAEIAAEIEALGAYQPPPPPPSHPRWLDVIDGISAAETPAGLGEDGRPHPGYAGPPNAASEELIAEALA